MVTKEEKEIWEAAAEYRKGWAKGQRRLKQKKKEEERKRKREKKEEERIWKKMRAETIKAGKKKAKKVGPGVYVMKLPKGTSRKAAIGLGILKGAKIAARLGLRGAKIAAKELGPKKGRKRKRVKIKIGRRKKRKRKRKRRR